MSRCPLRLPTLFSLLMTTPLVAGLSQTAPGDSALSSQLDQWYRAARRVAPGEWGIAIGSQDGQLLWGIKPTSPLIPASTVKLFTTGFARSVLGGEARRYTRVTGVGQVEPTTGTWVGSWALELNGDPTLERPSRGGPTLAGLASQLREKGVRRLVGPLLVVSAEGLAQASYPSAWALQHRGRYYAPPVGSLTLNENVVTFSIAPGKRTGARAVLVGASPAGFSDLVTVKAKTVAGRNSRIRYHAAAGGQYTVTGTIGTRARVRTFTTVSRDPRTVLEAVWDHALHGAGIEWQRVSGLSAPSESAERQVLAEVRSESFDSIASEVNRRSVNVGAELLLRWAASGADPAERLTAHVRAITGDHEGVRLVDGSGLSRDDRATPMSFVSYLARFPLAPGGKNFPQLLPANGSGTLRKLGNGLPESGIVRAKTGTLGGVSTLAGYLGRSDGVLLISLMYNGRHAGSARQQQWRLFRLLGAKGVVIPGDTFAVGYQLGGEGGEPPTPAAPEEPPPPPR